MQRPACSLIFALFVGLSSGAFSAARAAENIEATKVGPVRFDPLANRLILRLSGKKPTWQVMRNGAQVLYLDIKAPGQVPAQLQEDWSHVLKQVHPIVKEIRLAQHRQGVVRLAVEGAVPFSFAPTLTRDGDRWVLAVEIIPDKPRARSSLLEAKVATSIVDAPPAPPSSSAEVSAVKIEAATPSMRLAACLVALPSQTPTPAASPSPPPVLQQPVSKLELRPELEITYAFADLSENYEVGSSKSKVAGNDIYAITWHEHWSSDWSSALQVRRWGTYTIVDGDLYGSSHNRTETWVTAAIAHPLKTLGVQQSLAIGYMARSVQNDNTFAPPQPNYMFSKQQLYHGVVISDRCVIPLMGPLSAVIGFSAQPFTLAVLEPGIPAIGTLYGVGTELGIEAAIGAVVGRFSYRYDTLRQLNDSFQDISAPELSVSYRF